MPYLINSSCTKCGACLTECPTDSIAEGTDKYYIDTDTCADHAACVSVCPVNAIIKVGRSDEPSTERNEKGSD